MTMGAGELSRNLGGLEMNTNVDWLRNVVAEGLSDMLDQIAKEDGRVFTEAARKAGLDAMAASIERQWRPSEEGASAMRRDFTEEQIKAAVRSMYEPQYRREIAHRRPS